MDTENRPHWKEIRSWFQKQVCLHHLPQCLIGDYALPLKIEGMKGSLLEVSVQAKACPLCSQPLETLPDDAPVKFTFVDDELQFLGFTKDGEESLIGLTWAT